MCRQGTSGAGRKNPGFESALLDLKRGEQHRPDYLKLNPKAVVPTLADSDRVITDSSAILFYIEETAPEPCLLPADPGCAQTRRWLKRVDDLLHPGCTTVTFAISDAGTSLKT